MFYGSAFVACMVVAVTALARGSLALGVLLLVFAAIMAAILVSAHHELSGVLATYGLFHLGISGIVILVVIGLARVLMQMRGRGATCALR
jgi:hypothetical protein